jgi:hypothetical protein
MVMVMVMDGTIIIMEEETDLLLTLEEEVLI